MGWFVSLAAAAGLALSAGLLLGRGPMFRALVWLSLGISGLLVWSWLSLHPSVAVLAIPVSILSYIEGVAAVPVFMFVIGIVYSRSKFPRQRRLAALAIVLGGVFYVAGGMWMVQSTPRSVMARHYQPGYVPQSVEYSCVPAACATSLNLLGVKTTEAEMAQLTRTRPGTGATLVRAMDGLNQRLSRRQGWPIRVVLLEPSYEQMITLPTPLLTPMSFESTRQHMVTLLAYDDQGVWIADPQNAVLYMCKDEFLGHYNGAVLVFHR